MHRSRRAGVLTLTFLAALLAAAPAFAKTKAKKPDVEAVIARAKAAVEAGNADPARDLQPLLDLLPAVDELWDVKRLVNAIEELGSYEQWSPPGIKEYFRSNAPRQVIARLRRDPPVKDMGGAVLMLRGLNIDAAAIDEVVAATLEYRGEDGQVKFEGRLLADWKDHQPANPVAGKDPAKEKTALDLLRARRLRMTPYSLEAAARDNDLEVLQALFDGGMEIPRMATAVLVVALGYTRPGGNDGAARLAIVDFLLARGADPTYADGYGNTLLMAAVRNDVAVIARLLEAGAKIDALNAGGASALLEALRANSWEVAEFLVERGARASAQALDKVFLEKPQDPKKRALLERATAKP